VSKAAADQAARLYARHQGLHVVVARPFNHIGPGQQPPFAVPSFVRQLRDVAAGRAAEVRVGNLDARRDFTDVRDVVRAYRLLLERGRPGEAYNIASGRRIAVRDVFDRLCRKLGVEPRIVSDPGLFRPADDSPLLDTRKLRHDTAWAPERDLDATLTDILAS
jgi:GDP-4-dehydro-6-deoxy-D-mannose reductase